MKQRTKLIIMVTVSSIASQISLNMFQSGFILAMSPLMMGFFLYIFKDLNAFKACCWMAVVSPLVRLIVVILQSGDVWGSMHIVLPDIGFFFGYAICFALMTKNLGYAPYHKFYIRIVLADFFGNCCEQTLRVMAGLTTFTLDTFSVFITIALIRSFVVVVIGIAADTYSSLLERKEHEENYKKLLLTASTFESEVYSMRKNMNEIEDIMTHAFALYRDLDSSEYPPELKDNALTIAKDIHEVKKGYKRVIKGLQDNFLSDFNDDSRLPISDLLKILSVDVDRARDLFHQDITFHYSYETNHVIQKHFAFMSILRNFISNSIDALGDMPSSHHGDIYVRCRDMTKDGTAYCAVEVKDNGPGIAPDIVEFLFVPGYSTKFNEATGDINRGVGLTLAKDLMESQFNGHIEIHPGAGGALSTLWFPVEDLTARENSYSNLGGE